VPDFPVCACTRTTQWIGYYAIRQDVLWKISGVIHQHGAQIAFPTSSLHIPAPAQLAQAASAQANK